MSEELFLVDLQRIREYWTASTWEQSLALAHLLPTLHQVPLSPRVFAEAVATARSIPEEIWRASGLLWVMLYAPQPTDAADLLAEALQLLPESDADQRGELLLHGAYNLLELQTRVGAAAALPFKARLVALQARIIELSLTAANWEQQAEIFNLLLR